MIVVYESGQEWMETDETKMFKYARLMCIITKGNLEQQLNNVFRLSCCNLEKKYLKCYRPQWTKTECCISARRHC